MTGARHLKATHAGTAAGQNGGATAPTVSIIVPCYNYAHLLEGCVASVLAQDGVRVRVLIIDDCSPDDTAAVAQRLAEHEERIKFRRHTTNMGLIATANEGLQWADGDYLVLLSADDFLVPDCLRRATTIMEEHAGVGMVYGKPLIANEGRPIPIPTGRWRGTDIWAGEDWVRMRCRSGHNCMSSPEVVVRNSVQRAVGGYDPSCFHTSDLNMWLRIAAVSEIAYVRGVPQAIYRVHAASMQRSQDALTNLRERRAAFDRCFAESGAKLENPQELQAIVGRTLARQALWSASRAVDRNEDEVVIRGLVDFALDVCPQGRRLREWRGLLLRQRIGAGRSLVFLPFLLTGAAHRLRKHATQARWKLRGV